MPVERPESPVEAPLPTYDAECCRVWPIVYGYRVGRCGLCGERPTPIQEET